MMGAERLGVFLGRGLCKILGKDGTTIGKRLHEI